MNNYQAADEYISNHMRTGILSRRARRSFIKNWLQEMESGYERDVAVRVALKTTRKELGNPLLWFAISWAIENLLVPLLIRWWENRQK